MIFLPARTTGRSAAAERRRGGGGEDGEGRTRLQPAPRQAPPSAKAYCLLAAALAVAASALAVYPDVAHAQSPSDAPAMCVAGFDELEGAQDVDTFAMGNATYAIVASSEDDGVQLIRIGDGGALSAVSSATDGVGNFTELEGARAVDAFAMGNKTYAIVASRTDHGLQLIQIHGNGTMTPEDSSDEFGTRSFDVIEWVTDVAAFTMGNATYVLASSPLGQSSTLELIRVHGNGTLSEVSNATFRGGFDIWEVQALDVFDMGGKVHAIATGHWNNGGSAQLIRVHENGTMSSLDSVRSGNRGFDLSGPEAVHAFTMGNATYAIVSAFDSNTVGLIHVNESFKMNAVSSAIDNTGEFNTLSGPWGIDTLAIGGDMYAAVASYWDDGVQLIRVHEDGNLTAGGSLGGSNIDSDLDGATGIAAFALGDAAYAITASYVADAVQVVGVRGGDDSGLRFVSSASDGDGYMCPGGARAGDAIPTMSPADLAIDGGPAGFDELDGARDIDAFEMGNHTYAIAASYIDDGIQLIRIGDGGALAAVSSATDGAGGFDKLDGARAVDAFEMGDETYAIAASWDDHGVQLIRIHEDGAMESADSATDGAGGFLTLGEASDVDIFTMGEDNATYAIVSSYLDSGVQLIRVHGNGTLSAAGNATNGAGGFDALLGPRALDAFEMGDGTYAAVASERSNGVQLIQIHDNGTMEPAGSVFEDRESPESELDGPWDIDAFDVGNTTYAIVASFRDSGVQLIRIHGDGNLSKAGHAADGYAGHGPSDTLEGASGVDTFELGDATYAIVASYHDSDATLIRVHGNGTLDPVGSATGGGGTLLYDFDGVEGVDAFELGDATYAIVASYNDDAVQLVRVRDDGGGLSVGASVSDYTGGFVALEHAEAIDAVAVGDATYAVAVSRQDGVQLIQVHGNGTMEAAGSASHRDDGFGALREPNSVDAFAIGNDTYAIVTLLDTGVQLIRFHGNGTMEAAGTAIDAGLPGGTSGFDKLAGARAVDAFEMGNATFAIVASHDDDAVQLIRIHGNGTMTTAGSADRDFIPMLDGALDVDAFAIGNDTYALVVSKDSDDRSGVQMIRVRGDGTMRPVGSATDNTGGYNALGGARAVDVFGVGNRTFAMVASYDEHAVQLIQIHGNGTMSPAGLARETPEGRAGGFDGLGYPSDVDTFAVANRTYAIVTGHLSSAVQLIRVHYDGTLSPAGSAIDGGDFELAGSRAVAAFDTGGHTYAAVASDFDHAVQLIRMAPSIARVDSADMDGLYGIGDKIDIDVHFYGLVNVTGQVELRLNSGGAARFHDGNGTGTLTFRYMVERGDGASDLDYDGADALSGGGSIADALGVEAYSALPAPGSKDSLGGARNMAIDTMQPTVVSVSSPNATGTYGIGDRIAIHVLFTEAVLVTGTPLLELETGDYDARAWYVSGNGTETLVFLYAVRDGDGTADLNYTGTGALTLGNGTIADGIRNSAALALPDPLSDRSLGGGASTIEIDTVRPTVVSVSSPNATASYGTGDRIAIHVLFTEPVYVTGRPLIELETGDYDARAVYSSGSGTQTLEFLYAVRGGDRSADLNYTGTGALTLNGGTIADGVRNNATLALPDPLSDDSLGGSAAVIRVDGVEPSVLSVSSPNATGVYGAGKRIAIHVLFTEAVLVTGMPLLELETGDDDAQAAYASGGGTQTLEFLYTVRDGDNSADLNYAGTGALTLNGGAIRSNAGDDAVLDLADPRLGASLSGAKTIAIDTMQPSVLSVSSPNATGAYGIGDRIAIHVLFTEAVYVAGAPLLALETGDDDARAAYASGNGTRTLEFLYAVRDGDSTADLNYAGTAALALGGGSIRDLAGNNATLALPDPLSDDSLGGSSSIAVNTEPPPPASVSSVSSPNATGTYSTGDRIAVHVRFTDPVLVTGMPLLELETGDDDAQAAYASGSGTRTLVFLYTVRAGDVAPDLDYTGTGALTLGDGGTITDLAGNNASLALPDPLSDDSLGGSSSIAVDTDMPPPAAARPEAASASVLRRAGGDPMDSDVSYTAGQDIAVEVRFTAPVDVDTSGGAPYLELLTGSAGARAGYAAGSGTDRLEFSYAVRGGDLADRLSYAGAGALRLGGGAIAAAGSDTAASTVLPEPGAPGSLSAPGSPVVRIDPEPGRPVLGVGILDDEEGAGGGGGVREAALAAAYAFNERQGRSLDALLINATAYDAGGTAAAAATALQAAHAGGAGPSVYVGPSTDRGLHAAMPYAAANNIVLVSAGSTAPSLAVGDDTAFRLSPGGRLDAEALARLARTAGAQSMVAVLENATHGPPTAAGASLADATPPPPDRFSRAFDAALGFVGTPTLSGTVTLGGAAGGPYAAAAAAEALDAAVQAAVSDSSSAAVVYAGSPDGLAALAAAASASHPDLASAEWIASGQSAGSSLLSGDGPAAAFAAQAGLQAVRWSPPANDLARAVDSLALSPGADAGARHRAYAAYDAMSVIGMAAAATDAATQRGDTPDAAAVAEELPDAAAAYVGALGDIALNYAGDLWVPAAYDLWAVSRPGGAGTAAEWTEDPGALDETRACSIALTRAKIDYGPIDSGQTSRPHLQTIVNTGQLPFSRVDLTATPWHVDSPGSCAPGSMPSLPVGLSEIRTVAGGQFSDLAGTGTVLAQGLEAGSRSPLWYRLSLAGYADLPQAEITQCATYVVRCG